MLPTEKLKAVTQVIVHDNCADGLMAAIVIAKALAFHGSQPFFQFIQYGTKAQEQLEARPGMLFCDITPPKERAIEFARQGAIVIDHHKSAKEVTALFEDGIYEEAPGVSGATLAYNYLLPKHVDNLGLLKLVTLTGVYDSWAKENPLWLDALRLHSVMEIFYPRWSEKTCSGVMLFEKFASIKELHSLRLGAQLLERELDHAKRVAKGGFDLEVNHVRVKLVQGVLEINLVAEAECLEDVDLVVGFLLFNNSEALPEVLFSLRSHKGFDCSALAKHFGGGGHPGSAGFKLPFGVHDPNPIRIFEAALVKYFKETQDG